MALLLACVVTGLFTVPGRAQSVTPLLNLTNAVWRFNDAGIDLGTAWRAPSYPSESTWPSGRGLFGVEVSVPYPYPVPIRTSMALGGGRTTHYFRTRFNYTGSAAGLNLRFTTYVDDGAVFYLNGNEVGRVRMPAGPVSFSTKASLAFPEGVAATFIVPVSSLNSGENVVAVEVHQNSDTTSDVVFGLALDLISGQPPAILDPAEPADRAVPQDSATTLSFLASGFPAPGYQWFKGNQAIPGATAPTFPILSMSATDAGSYFCVASNIAGVVTSRVASVVYLPDTNGPTILYALGQPNLTDVLVVFTEAPDGPEAEDPFRWLVIEAGSGALFDVAAGVLTDRTNLVLTLLGSRDPNRSYRLVLTSDLREAVDHGNILPAGTEAPIAWFEVPLVTLDETHVWRFNASGTEPPADWMSDGYDDSAWPQGTALFEVVPGSDLQQCRTMLPTANYPVRTCFALSNATTTAQMRTAYFRTRFRFEGDAGAGLLRLHTFVNDGAIIYLNGERLFSLAMPDGALAYGTRSTRTIGTAFPEQFEQFTTSLRTGDNLLAVEVHQGTLQTANLAFGLELIAVQPTRPVIRPRLNIRIDGGSAEITWTPEGGVLESTDDLNMPWVPVGSGVSPGRLIVPAAALRQFYRVAVETAP